MADTVMAAPADPAGSIRATQRVLALLPRQGAFFISRFPSLNRPISRVSANGFQARFLKQNKFWRRTALRAAKPLMNNRRVRKS